jgi:uncharacterized membrane protein
MLVRFQWSTYLLALFFVVAGVMHFVQPRFYVAMMPKVFPKDWRLPLVQFTGICEIAGGLGVLVPATQHLTGVLLIIFLIAILPANIQMLMNAIAKPEPTGTIVTLWIRLPLQGLLIWWVWKAAAMSRTAVG